jgi:hypothetical protein
MKKVIFIFLLALGFAWNCNAQSWTYVQDRFDTFCNAGSTSCTLQPGNLSATLPGSIWVVIVTTNNGASNPVTISSVTGGGGSWQLCPASSCHAASNSPSRNMDMAYNLTGNAGTTVITVNLSAAAVGQFGLVLVELLPPPGSVASFDVAGGTSTSSCTTCTGVGLGTLAGTDAVVQAIAGTSPSSWNAWSAPYITLPLGEGINLNATDGAAPTVVTSGPGAVFTAIAFKSTAAHFTPPPQPISVVNYSKHEGLNCSPSCSLGTSVGSGHLLYIEAGSLNGTHISSVSGGGTAVVPSGANTCEITLSSSETLSCAYILSSTAGSLSVTMSGGSNVSFAIWELASASGPFSFDKQGSATNSASLNPHGVALSPLNGSNDVIFQSAFIPGGTEEPSLYPMPRDPGQATMFFLNEAACAALINTTNGGTPIWDNPQNSPTVVSGIAFSTGTATALAPPTGLTAVVN